MDKAKDMVAMQMSCLPQINAESRAQRLFTGNACLLGPDASKAVRNCACDMTATARVQRLWQTMSILHLQDMVKVLVRFSRCLFAQLVQQTCEPPRGFPSLPATKSPEFRAAQLGMMLTCGFEMLAASSPPEMHADQAAAANGSASVSEGPAPTQAGAHQPNAWAAFEASLVRNGYFGADIPGEHPNAEQLWATDATSTCLAAYRVGMLSPQAGISQVSVQGQMGSVRQTLHLSIASKSLVCPVVRHHE